MNSVLDTTTIQVIPPNDINATRLAKYLQGDEWCADQFTTVETHYNNPFPTFTDLEESDSTSSGTFLNSPRYQTDLPLWGAKPRVQAVVVKTLHDLYKSPLEVVQTSRIETDLFIQAVRARLNQNQKNEDKFLERVLRLEKMGNIDSALDLLYDQIDARLKAGKFEDTDKFLQKLNVAKLSIDLLLGVLTASLPARYKLPSRGVFYKKVEAVLKQRNEWEENLLLGLES